jgi:hypothetical protein
MPRLYLRVRASGTVDPQIIEQLDAEFRHSEEKNQYRDQPLTV